MYPNTGVAGTNERFLSSRQTAEMPPSDKDWEVGLAVEIPQARNRSGHGLARTYPDPINGTADHRD